MATDIRVERREAAQPAAPAPAPRPSPARRLPLGRGELISGGSALALLALLFLAKWYGVAGVPDPSAARPAVSTAINAWHGLSIIRWVMLLTIVVAVGSVVLHLSQRSHGVQTDTSRLVTALGSLTAVLLIYRVLIALPGGDRITDQKVGAVLALLCAVGIALGGRQSMLEAKRARPRAIPRRRRDRAAPAKIIPDNATSVADRGRDK